jgi:hypothetical protein
VAVALHVLSVVAGLTVIAFILSDVFQAVVLPRAASINLRISARLVRLTWPLWVRAGIRIADGERREDFLGAYGPFALVSFLLLWGSGSIVGYGFIFYGLGAELRPVPNLGEALYFAGTSFLTIGYGDIVPTGGTSRLVSLLAGASGFSIIAIVTAFLFSVFGSFQARENFVVTFGTRAGAPPSGVTLLETYAKLGIVDDLDDVFEEGMRWAAAVLENHLAYPILAYFRSSHDYESWVAVLGALLDASTLRITLVTGDKLGHAKLFGEMGRHAVRDLAGYFNFEADLVPGVERAEFDLARARLAAAGLPVRDSDDAWDKFVALRSTYAGPLNEMAHYFRIPPALWVGDRSLLNAHTRGALPAFPLAPH